MSQEAVDTTRAALEAVNENGLLGFTEFLADEVVWHTDPLVPEPGIYEGKDVVVTYLQGWLRAITELRIEIHSARPVGADEALVETTVLGQPLGPAEGETHFLNWALIVQIQDGLIVRIRSYLDRDRALEAVGLRE